VACSWRHDAESLSLPELRECPAVEMGSDAGVPFQHISNRMHIFSPDHIAALVDRLWDVAVLFVPRLLVAALLVAMALVVSRRASRGIFKLMSRSSHVDDTLRFALAELVRYSIIVLILVMAMEQLGVRATSLLAVMGAAGLAIGLALQGTLSNIAAGLMLLWLRPFRINDYIEVNNTPGLAGTVRQIGLFSCQLEAFDGLFLFVPNSGLWNVPLRNYSRNNGRLISLAITIPYALPFDKARDILLDVARKDPKIAKNPEPVVFIERVSGDSLVLGFRVWSAPQDVGEIQRSILGACQEALAGALQDGSSVQVTRITPPDNDPTRLMTGAPSPTPSRHGNDAQGKGTR